MKIRIVEIKKISCSKCNNGYYNGGTCSCCGGAYWFCLRCSTSK